MQLYELVLNEGHTVSPFVWRVKMHLAHKGLEPERVAIGYGEKDKLAFSGQDRVPVLVDGDRTVFDSWHIAEYLEDTYPDRPSLFGGAIGQGTALFFNRWCDTQQLGQLFLLCAPATYDLTPEADQPYFRDSRYAWTGMTIDEMRVNPEHKIERLRDVLEPVRQTLTEQDWLSGDAPAFADYCLFGGFMWARTTLRMKLLAPDDPVELWRQKMLDLFDGLARKAPAAEID